MNPGRNRLFAGAAWVLLGGAAPALAAAPATDGDQPSVVQGPPLTWSFRAGATTDYVAGGMSQSGGRPSAFAGVDLGYQGFYAGAWTANVDYRHFGDSTTHLEVDVYGGWRAKIAGAVLDIGLIRYSYPVQPSHGRLDYEEGYVRFSQPVGAFVVGAATYYSPDYTGREGPALYFEGNLAYALTSRWSVSAVTGRRSIGRTRDYDIWNAGAEYKLNPRVALDLRFWDTDELADRVLYGPRLVAKIKLTI